MVYPSLVAALLDASLRAGGLARVQGIWRDHRPAVRSFIADLFGMTQAIGLIGATARERAT